MTEEALSPILAEYDDLLGKLQAQINVYKTEHALLRNELIKLLTQNKDLHNFVDSEFERRLEVDFSAQINPIINSEMVRNLRKQLELSLQERRQLKEMFQASQNQIDRLKGQITIRDSEPVQVRRKQDPTISLLESKVEGLSLELRMEKSAREDQESVRLKAQTEAAKLSVLLSNQSETIENLEEKMRVLGSQCKAYEQENTVIQATLDCVSQSREALEAALTKAEEKERALKALNDEAKTKVEEAVEVAEKAVAERDSALQREAHLQLEVTRLGQCLDHVIDEAGRRLNAEVKQVRDICNDKLSKLAKEMEKKESELALETSEGEKLIKQCRDLKMTLESRKHADDQLEGLAKDNIDLQSRLESNHRQLEDTKQALSDVLTENEKLQKDFAAATTREAEFRQLVGDLQTQVQSCRCAKLKDKLKTVKAAKTRQTTELERQVATQLALNEKWQKESEALAALLQEKMQKSAKQSEKLRALNKKMSSKLKDAKTAFYTNEKQH